MQKALAGPRERDELDRQCTHRHKQGPGAGAYSPIAMQSLQMHQMQAAGSCRPPLARLCSIFAAIPIHQSWSGRPESNQVRLLTSDTAQSASSSEPCPAIAKVMHANCWYKPAALTIEALAPALTPLITRWVKFAIDQRALRLPAAFALGAAAEWVLDLACQFRTVGVLLFGWRALRPGEGERTACVILLGSHRQSRQPRRSTHTFQSALCRRLSDGIP